jgi:hypothetical protein
MRSMADSLPGAMQPIVCCLGARVAGKPTQFLLERAIAVNELDWRAITIELAAQDLPVAIAGMKVMRFMGLRFFPSLQPDAARQLAPEDGLVQFIGSVTSAAWGSQSWQAWHHWGGAILTWAAPRIEKGTSVCWLHGDSVRSRSLWAALLEDPTKVSGAVPTAAGLRTVMWSSPPEELPPQRKKESELELVVLETQEQGIAHLRAKAAGGQLPTVLLVGEQFPNMEEYNLASATKHCLVASDEVGCRQAKLWSHPSLRILPEVEQIVACEAFDFQRWTGHQVSLHLLRDAYDEYNGF